MKIVHQSIGIQNVRVAITVFMRDLPRHITDRFPRDFLFGAIEAQIAGALSIINAPIEIEITDGYVASGAPYLEWPMAIDVEATVDGMFDGHVSERIARLVPSAIEYVISQQ